MGCDAIDGLCGWTRLGSLRNGGAACMARLEPEQRCILHSICFNTRTLDCPGSCFLTCSMLEHQLLPDVLEVFKIVALEASMYKESSEY